MNDHSRWVRLFPAAFATLALSAAAIAAPQEDAKAVQQRPVTDTAQPAPAAAQSGTTPTSNSTLAQTKFDQLDINHDGYVDKTEASASSVLAAQFDKIDGNHDGKLSLSEFASIKDLAAIKVDRKGYQ